MVTHAPGGLAHTKLSAESVVCRALRALTGRIGRWSRAAPAAKRARREAVRSTDEAVRDVVVVVQPSASIHCGVGGVGASRGAVDPCVDVSRAELVPPRSFSGEKTREKTQADL